MHPDGERLVVAMPAAMASSSPSDRFVVVVNFFDELRRLAPAGR